MVTDFLAGLGVFKTIYDSAKSLKDMNDGAIRNGAVIELLEKILSAREAQAALLEKVSALEKEIAAFETGDAEKLRYELKTTGGGGFVYTLKPDAQPPEPPHQICANCYQSRRKSFLQKRGQGVARISGGLPPTLVCAVCGAEIPA